MSGKSKLARRRFLQSLGLGAAGLLLPSRHGGRAQDAVIPKRVLFLTTSHGSPREHWQMGLGLGSTALADLDRTDFSLALEPLYDVRDKLTIVEGLCMTSAMMDEPDNNHNVAKKHVLSFGAGEQSVDQIIADAVALPGAIRSFEWGTGGGYSHAPGGVSLPTEGRPSRAYSRLFPDGPPTMEPPPEPTRRELIRAERPSVLDMVAREYDQIFAGLGAEDRVKLEHHQQLIRDLELRLGAMPPVADGCDPDYIGSDDDRADGFFRLATIAFSCDVTRVVSINLGQLATADFGAPATDDVHQDYAHSGSVEAVRHMGSYYRHHADQLRSLVEMLDAVPEAGGTLLDNTAIVWSTELATGHHEFFDTFALVAGGLGGTFAPGRYVRYPQDRPSPCDTYGCTGDMIGPSTSELMVTIMQAMGLSADRLGLSTGSALDGSSIDLSGPLIELYG